jgi:DNA-binding beta-propeller fold protein YncE
VRRQERFAGRGAPFEGDRTVWSQSIPKGAQLRSAVLTVTPVAAPGADPFEETITFAGDVGTWGATQVRSATGVPRWVEVDFHARRTLAAITGPDLVGAALQADLGGVYVQVNDVGAVKVPNEGTLFTLDAGGQVPGLTVAKFKLTHATKRLAVSQLTIASVASNLTARFGAAPSFWARPGEFTTPQLSPDVAAALQTALATAAVDGGFYRLPIVVHSDTICRLDIALDVEFVLDHPALPGGLTEATVVYDVAGVPAPDAAAITVTVPSGARLVPSAVPARVTGAFERSRVAFGPVGSATPLDALEVTPARALAQPVTVAADLLVTAVDLLAGATTDAAVLRLDLVGDLDGKPSDVPLLTRPVELALDRDVVGDATWVSVALPAPFGLQAGRRYWLTVQATSGEATWSVRRAGGPPGTQHSVDGGLSWRLAPVVGGGPAEGLLRLREVPEGFTMPIELHVGDGALVRRVGLERFAPLGRVEVDLNAPEILDGINAVVTLAAGAGACPTGEHVRNGDFARWRRTADLPTGSTEISLGYRARRIAVAADGCVAHVAGGLADGDPVFVRVGVLDVPADRAGPVSSATATMFTIGGLASAPDGGHGYVLVTDNDAVAVHAHDRASGQVAVSVLDGPATATGLAISPDGALLYAGLSRSIGEHVVHVLVALDAAALHVGGTAVKGREAVLDDSAADLAVSPDGATIWVLTTGEVASAVVAVDVAAMTLLDRVIPLTAPAGRCALSRGGATLAVVHPTAARISVVDLGSAAVSKVELADDDEPGPSGVAVSADGVHGFVALRGADAVAVVDLRAGRVLRRVPVGSEPLDCAITPDGERILVADGAGADGDRMTVLRIGTLAAEDWTVTAGRVRPRCLPPGGRAALLGVLSEEAAAAHEPTATAVLAQVTPARGGCRYEFGFVGLASAEGATAEVQWIGPECAPMRVDTVPVRALAPRIQHGEAVSVDPQLQPHLVALDAPVDAEQAEIRFRSPAGVLAAVDRVGMRAVSDVVVNGGFGRDADVLVGWQITPGDPAGFSAVPAAGGVALSNLGSGAVALTQGVTVVAGQEYRLAVDASAGGGPAAVVEVVWPGSGAPLAVALTGAGADRQVVTGRAPVAATAAQIRIVLPPGSAVTARRIGLELIESVTVPLTFVAQSAGELTVSNWQLSFDVDETPQVPPPPTAGLCRPSMPEPAPGEGGSESCHCPTCEGEHRLDDVEVTRTASGVPATQGRCAHCGSSVVVPGRTRGDVRGGQVDASAVRVAGRPAPPGPDLMGLLVAPPMIQAPELADVHGIGAGRAVLLNRIGIIGLPDLAVADVHRLAELPGVNETMAGAWVLEARRLTRWPTTRTGPMTTRDDPANR